MYTKHFFNFFKKFHLGENQKGVLDPFFTVGEYEVHHVLQLNF